MNGDPDTLDVVAQADYETVLAALRDYIRLSEGRRETYGVDHTLRLAEIRELAATARPVGSMVALTAAAKAPRKRKGKA